MNIRLPWSNVSELLMITGLYPSSKIRSQRLLVRFPWVTLPYQGACVVMRDITENIEVTHLGLLHIHEGVGSLLQLALFAGWPPSSCSLVFQVG